MYDEALTNNWLSVNDWSQFTVLEPIMDLPGLSRTYIKQQLRRAYYRFYTRPSFIWKQLKMKNLEIFKVAYKALRNRYRKC